MKILKDANCVPPAVEIMQQIEAKKNEFSNCTDSELKDKLGKEIRSLELKRNLLLENQ
ncbi:hypothetical protein JCM19240_278 [Vibrio maritimus]|uniref:Uncharacterized protein n=1 Tax=Vibrio maritimus TaxID=990268 RepID=A0A090T668_9VIBR|nr:hypothetical protein JCM19240_278 [Vibrio maritimus]